MPSGISSTESLGHDLHRPTSRCPPSRSPLFRLDVVPSLEPVLAQTQHQAFSGYQIRYTSTRSDWEGLDSRQSERSGTPAIHRDLRLRPVRRQGYCRWQERRVAFRRSVEKRTADTALRRFERG